MITEDYVSVDIAKLLKEKGFNEECHLIAHEHCGGLCPVYQLTTNSNVTDKSELFITVPTLQMVMKWFREVHKLGVFPTTYYREINRNAKHDYGSTIVMLDTYEVIGNGKNIEDYTFEAETYEETAEKAIKYCLENLI